MLTNEQTREALEWLGPVRLDVDDPERIACRDALAAYSRVAAVLDDWPDGDAFVVIVRGGCPRYPKAELRRALEG
jgi:hypothetical protein